MLILLQGNYEKTDITSGIINTDTEKFQSFHCWKKENIDDELVYRISFNFTNTKVSMDFTDEEYAKKSIKSILSNFVYSAEELGNLENIVENIIFIDEN